ncbi:MAG: leucyl/phenylalanyl-tRNA--protein transferase [Bacteroidetes bacterium]|nr:leucyl/phenylalanyl-tRNA--protein transferase [Bacteroidota bacterium]
MIYLSNELWFPPISESSSEGLLAIGGDLSASRLLLAYQSGVFPWYEKGDPILWWSPDPRMVLFPDSMKVSKSMRQLLKKNIFRVSMNTSFSDVIRHCAEAKRQGQEDTWITEEMIRAYENLHHLGHAISIEVWKDDQLVGGLYGIDLPDRKVFCGESMFSTESNASKVGFYFLVESLKKRHYKLIDCQVYTDHLASLGAEKITRTAFLSYLQL